MIVKSPRALPGASRAVEMLDSRLRRRLMLDRRQHPLGRVLHAELHEAEIRRDPHGTIEDRPVQPLLVHIAQEISYGDRRLFALQFQHESPLAGLDRDLHRRWLRGRTGLRRRGQGAAHGHHHPQQPSHHLILPRAAVPADALRIHP
jgi:hypothetical protein